MPDTEPTSDPLDDAAFRVAAELAGIGVWVFEPDVDTVILSDRASMLYGVPSAVAIGAAHWHAMLDGKDRDRAAARLAEASPLEPIGTFDFTLMADDGQILHLSEAWRVTHWQNERAVRIVGCVSDVSQQHRGEDRRRDLVIELQHRLKNLLGVIRSLARRTAANSQSVDEFVAHFDGRLAALAHVQTTLVRSINGLVDLEDIVRQELMHSLGPVANVTVEGPAVALRGKIAELVALALHELSANTIKFGALNGNGTVSVTWQLRPAADNQPQRLVLTWLETGASVPFVIHQRGFGMALIERGLPYELDATVTTEVGDDSLSCCIDLPLRPRGVG